MEATIYRSTGSWYDLKDDTGRSWKGRIKGVFKIDGITSTNPLAVGDRVIIEVENEAQQVATIIDILPRHNYISRQSPSHRKQHHIIASNVDQSMLICTFRHPRTSTGFADRFLVASEAYHVPAVLVVNKCDTWKARDEEMFETWQALYAPLGYAVLKASALQQQGLEAVKSLLANKTTLLSGHSGVGKSSLLNALIPGWQLRTKAVSDWSGKGMHTTTFAEMMDLPFGGRVIDTPGLREFGIVDIPREELSHYFPEMREVIHHCQFNNCQHLNEPGCAVKQAVREGRIAEDRYVSYYNIYESIPEHDWK